MARPTDPMLYGRAFANNMNSLLWLNAGVAIAGISLAVLLPKRMADQRKGG